MKRGEGETESEDGVVESDSLLCLRHRSNSLCEIDVTIVDLTIQMTRLSASTASLLSQKGKDPLFVTLVNSWLVALRGLSAGVAS